jgi:hypothetical protein
MQEQDISQGLNDLFGPPQNSMREDEAKSLIPKEQSIMSFLP